MQNENFTSLFSKEEISRLLQSSGNLYAEERLLEHSNLTDVNWDEFASFYEKKYGEIPEKNHLEHNLNNLRLAEKNVLNTAGALLFGKNIERLTPTFFVTAIWFWGDEITDSQYRSSENITGTLRQQYNRAFDFILSKLHKIQGSKSFNSLGDSEIPEIVLKEILTNALIHRDYFIHDSIKIFVFNNRVEILSPGRLPNSLTEEQIKRGIRRTRNHIIASFAPDVMEYRGAGSGILRAIKAYPQIQFHNEVEDDRFRVIIPRIEMPL